MKFKVGDKVLIQKQGPLGSSEAPWNMKGKMDKYDGHIGTIIEDYVGGPVDRNAYCLDIDEGEWIWGEDCLTDASKMPAVGDVGILRIIISDLVTKIEWSTGEETIVKCHAEDEFDAEKGIALAIMKYALGNTSSYNEVFHVLHKEQEKQKDKDLKAAMAEAVRVFSQLIGDLDEDTCD